jgi:hypothetical protein
MFWMKAYVTLVPQSVRYARALTVLDALYRREEALPNTGQSAAWRAFDEDALQLLETTANPFVRDLSGAASSEEQKVGRSTFALAVVVAHLEMLRQAAGRVPSSLPAEPWTHDPSTDAAAFGYELAGGGDGYRLWSVGKNGRDERGNGDDVRVERQAR